MELLYSMVCSDITIGHISSKIGHFDDVMGHNNGILRYNDGTLGTVMAQ